MAVGAGRSDHAAHVLAEMVYRSCTQADWWVSDDDLTAWSTQSTMTLPALLEAVALELAERFMRSEISFDIADDIANKVVGIPTRGDEVIVGEDFWEVYAALDEGEYVHDDRWDEDPVAAYTRPALTALLQAAGRTADAVLQPLQRDGVPTPLEAELGLDLARASSRRAPLPDDGPVVSDADRLAWDGRWADIAYFQQQVDQTYSAHAAAQRVLDIICDDPGLWAAGKGKSLQLLVDARTNDRVAGRRLDDEIRSILATFRPDDVPGQPSCPS